MEEKMDVGVEPPERKTSSSDASAATKGAMEKKRFEVELKPGETTIVSWKNLIREVNKENGSSASDSSLHNDAIVMFRKPPADNDLKGEVGDGKLPTNRFGNVIEKIERLYMGKVSSDEEDAGAYRDEDQYNTKDSFIDDTELNDYFEVDKLETKHTGFFVNRGKLEPLERSPSPNTTPKKRRRKESTKQPNEKGDANMPNEHVKKISNVRKMKDTTKDAQLVSGKLPRSSLPNSSELMKKGINKKRTDSLINLNISPSLKLKNKDLVVPTDVKDSEKQKGRFTKSRVIANKFRGSGESLKFNDEGVRDKNISSHVDSHIKKHSKVRYDTIIEKSIQRKESNRPADLDLNSPITGSILPKQSKIETKHGKEGSVVRPKDTTLERAILDLEKVVSELPSKSDAHEADASQGIRSILPAEVKQKLAKVTRLADSQGKITSEPFFDRLVCILGHLLQPKTLKRHLREIVELRLSVKQTKADKIRQIKKEMMEMIKTLVLSSKYKAVAEQQTSLPNAFQENPSEKAYKSKCRMTDAIEDKICDLDAFYVVETDADRDLQARKLYAEIVQLWPAGHMDSHGIRDAIYRARGRKRALNKQKCKIQGSESLKRKMPSSCTIDDNARPSQRPSIDSAGKERGPSQRSAIDSAGKVHGSSQRVGSNQVISSSDRISESFILSSPTGPNRRHVSKHHEKVISSRNVVSINLDDEEDPLITKRRNKLKRRPESDLGDVHAQSSAKRAKPLLSQNANLKDTTPRQVPKAKEFRSAGCSNK